MPVSRYWVYILASFSRRLSVGSTSNILRRLIEQRTGVGAEFCRRYRIDRLVHLEEAPSRRAALTGERQLKGWSRRKKISLIEATNFGWLDLSVDWLPASTGEPVPRER